MGRDRSLRWVIIVVLGLLSGPPAAVAEEISAGDSCLVPLQAVDWRPLEASHAVLPLDEIPEARLLILRAAGRSLQPAEFQIRTAGDPAETLHLLSTSSGQQSVQWLAVPNPDGSLELVAHASPHDQIDLTVSLIAYVPDSACYEGKSQHLISSSSGEGLGFIGPVPAGAEHELVGPLRLPRVMRFEVLAHDGDATITILDQSDGKTVDRVRIAEGSKFGGFTILPLSSDGYAIAVTGSDASLEVWSLGDFSDANAYASSPTMLFESPERSTLGRVVPGLLPLPRPMIPYLPEVFSLADDALSARTAVVEVSMRAYSDSEIRLWPEGDGRGEIPDLACAAQQECTATTVIASTPEGRFFADSTGLADLTIELKGFSARLPEANHPVHGVVHLAEVDEVQDPVVDGDSISFTYEGDSFLDRGDVLVVPPIEGAEDGYIGVVLSANPDPTATTVSAERGTLVDVFSSADFSEADLPVDSGEPQPLGDPDPLPPHPAPNAAPPAPSFIASTGLARASNDGRADDRSLVQTGGGGFSSSIPPSGTLSCSGALARFSSSLRMTGGITLSASWAPWSGVRADFNVAGGIRGQAEAWIGAAATCRASGILAGLRLAPIHFTIGPVPIWVTPQLALAINANGSVEAGYSIRASVDVGFKAGVRYDDGSFSSYFERGVALSASVGSRARAQIEVEVGPRLDLLIYGAAGPYAELKPFLNANVDLNANPWWRVEGGLRAGVGFRMGVWKVNANWGPSWRELWRSNVGQASGAYPGPRTTTTNLPTAIRGQGYTASLAGAGGRAPYSWYLVGGSLPPGIALSRSGALTGTSGALGTWSFDVRIIDSAGDRSAADARLALTVADQPQPPPPSRTMTVYKSGTSAQGLPGCSSSACRYVGMTMSGFPANTRIYYQAYDSVTGGPWRSSSGTVYTCSVTTNGSGYWSGNSCFYYGYTSGAVWLRTTSPVVVESNHLSWA